MDQTLKYMKISGINNAVLTHLLPIFPWLSLREFSVLTIRTFQRKTLYGSSTAEKKYALQGQTTAPPSLVSCFQHGIVACYLEMLLREKTEASLLLQSIPPPYSSMNNSCINDITGHVISLSICSSAVYEIV